MDTVWIWILFWRTGTKRAWGSYGRLITQFTSSVYLKALRQHNRVYWLPLTHATFWGFTSDMTRTSLFSWCTLKLSRNLHMSSRLKTESLVTLDGVQASCPKVWLYALHCRQTKSTSLCWGKVKMTLDYGLFRDTAILTQKWSVSTPGICQVRNLSWFIFPRHTTRIKRVYQGVWSPRAGNPTTWKELALTGLRHCWIYSVQEHIITALSNWRKHHELMHMAQYSQQYQYD